MTTIKWLFLVALTGHLLCGVCDCWLTYLPNGRFKLDYMKDNQKLSDVFKEMPLRNTILSMLLGCLAMCMMFFGYLALALWIRPISAILGNLMLLAVGLIFTFGIAHHILCGVPNGFTSGLIARRRLDRSSRNCFRRPLLRCSSAMLAS